MSYIKFGNKRIWIGWEKFADVIFILLISSLLILLLTILAIDARVQAICISNGYPEHSTTWNFIGYCIRTINQTQYVVPLNQILGK